MSESEYDTWIDIVNNLDHTSPPPVEFVKQVVVQLSNGDEIKLTPKDLEKADDEFLLSFIEEIHELEPGAKVDFTLNIDEIIRVVTRDTRDMIQRLK